MPITQPRNHRHIAFLVLFLAACASQDRYQDMDAEAIFRLAQNEIAEGNEDNAIEALERLRLSFPEWSRIDEARLLLARTYYDSGDYLSARSEYQRFRDRFVANPRAAEAALGECRALAALSPIPERDQTDTEEAITICGNVTVDYAGTPEAAQAGEIRASMRRTMAEKEYLNATHYFRRKQYDPAIIYYQFVVDLYPDTEFAPGALLGIYRANNAIGYEDLAAEARDKLLQDYPDSEEAAELRADGT